jgi:hypothetical protein
MTHVVTSEAPRRRRVHQLRDDRVHHVDMRTREGRQYRQAYATALHEFAGADPARVAQVVRLRLLAEREETAALTGKVGSADNVVRLAHAAGRAARDLYLTTATKGKGGADGSAELNAYLTSIADDEDTE